MHVASRWARGAIAGLLGGVAWVVGLMLFFGPAQVILGDASLQSAKFLAVFTSEPLPRVATAPWLMLVGVLAIGIVWGLVYVSLAAAWSGAWWRRGLRFGVVGWALMVPWFEFYLPWNAMGEPIALVALEGACWAAVLLLVGVTIAGVEAALRRGA